ncbi:MAG: exodeoxyribonuclease VII, partial [Lachnospiraceae bacterium]|nr:exodeoxyribonuclease VII [Lachnospiraceae bacterium]
RDDISLEAAFQVYSEGLALLKCCYDQIDRVEMLVLKLCCEGQLEEFEHEYE